MTLRGKRQSLLDDSLQSYKNHVGASLPRFGNGGREAVSFRIVEAGADGGSLLVSETL